MLREGWTCLGSQELIYHDVMEDRDSIMRRSMRVVLMGFVFVLVLALYPYTHNPAGPIKQLATDWALALLGPLCVLDVLVSGKGLRWRSSLTLLLGAFLLVNLVSALASEHLAHGLTEWRRWLGLSLLALYAAHACSTAGNARQLMGAMVLAVAASSVYGLYQATGWPDPFPWGQKNVEEYFGLPSTYANPNFAAHALVLGLILAAGLSRRQPLYLAPGLVIAVHLYLTAARGARVALLAALVLAVAAMWMRRRENRPLRAAWKTLLLAGAVVLAGAGSLVVAHRAVRQTYAPMDGSLLLRYNGYLGAARMALERPALGFGPGQYALYNAGYWTNYEQQWFATTGKKNMHVHNDLLETAIDAGVPGAALYMALLLWGVFLGLMLGAQNQAARDRPLGLVSAACVCAFAVDGLFGFNVRVPVSSTLLFLLLGLLSARIPAVALSRGVSIAAALAACVAALTSAVFGTQAFAAERHFQTAEFARYGSEQYAAQGNEHAAAAVRQKAYEALARGHELAPWDTRFPLFMALLDLRKGDSEAAVRRLTPVVAAEPENVQALVRLARAQVALAASGTKHATSMMDNAVAQLDRLERLCPCLPELWELRGALAAMKAQAAADAGRDAQEVWRAAAECFDKALVYGARDRAGLQERLALAHAHAGNVDEADRVFRQAAELKPEDTRFWRVYHGFASEHSRLGPFLDALHRAVDRLGRREPPPAAALSEIAWHLAVVYREKGEPELARRTLMQAISRDPGSLALWGELSIVTAPESRGAALAELASTSIQRLEQEHRAVPEALRLVAALTSPNAEQLLRGAEKLAGLARTAALVEEKDAVRRTLSWIGDVYIDALKAAPLAQPEQAQFLAWLGEVFVRSERWDAADEVFLAAIGALPESRRGVALAYYSEALAHLGRKDQALALAQEAAASAGDQILVRQMLARRLAESGRAAEARFEYRALLQRVAQSSTLHAELEAELAAMEQEPGDTP